MAAPFYDPVRVERLRAMGIVARRRRSLPEGAPSPDPPQGFVLQLRSERPRTTVTHVVAQQIGSTQALTITQPRLAAAPSEQSDSGPQTALELVEECARLRLENQRLTTENRQLRADLARAVPSTIEKPLDPKLDDTAVRFALLEFE